MKPTEGRAELMVVCVVNLWRITDSGAEVVSHMRGPQEAVQLGLFLGVPTVKVHHS